MFTSCIDCYRYPFTDDAEGMAGSSSAKCRFLSMNLATVAGRVGEVKRSDALNPLPSSAEDVIIEGDSRKTAG